MKTWRGCAVAADCDDPDWHLCEYRFTDGDQWLHRLIRRTQATNVKDRHSPDASDVTSEIDDTGCWGQDRFAEDGRQINASMSCQPPLRWRIEPTLNEHARRQS